MKTLISVITLILILLLIRMARADELNPLADMPWQTAAAGENTWVTFPYQGFPTTTATQINKPIGLGSLFESINWYQSIGNLNAGSSIEQTPIYMGAVWWDFMGGHHVMGVLNGELPLRLSYIEITYGYPGTDHESWWEIPQSDSLLGLTQIMPGPEGGWVTHVNLYTRDVKANSVPDAGTTIMLLGMGLMALVLFNHKLHGRTLQRTK